MTFDEGVDWASAACSGLDTELFFPAPGQPPRQARAICDGCPIADGCLAHALKRGERHGVWGGATPRERNAIREDRDPRQWRSTAKRVRQITGLLNDGFSLPEIALRLDISLRTVQRYTSSLGAPAGRSHHASIQTG